MHNDLLDTILIPSKNKDSKSPTASSSPGATPSPTTGTSPSSLPLTPIHPSNMSDNSSEPVCPVDHKTREVWLAQARAAGSNAPNPHGEAIPTQSHDAPSSPTPTPPPVAQASQASSWSPLGWLSSSKQQQTQQSPQQNQEQQTQQQSTQTTATLPSPLDTARTVSSIPRAANPGPSACPVPPSAASTTATAPAPVPASHQKPLNHEAETGADQSTGNWIYPSEKMFFDAMLRKGFNSTSTADMKTVVPIHNAVNEKAWAEIKRWEAPYAGECGMGPMLYSFAGIKERMTPRARLNTLLGYAAPFDRHDWVVDRCGKRVEYVIDFYTGRSDTQGAQGKVNFYLDVRPKVNSWEGVKMRALRAVGLA